MYSKRIEIERKRVLIQRFGRGYLARDRNRNKFQNIARIPTIFNPYESKTDLTTNDGKKMYIDVCKGLKEKNLYGGTKENWNGFVKLMRKLLNGVCAMEVLKVPTKWDHINATNVLKRLATKQVHLFNSVDRLLKLT